MGDERAWAAVERHTHNGIHVVVRRWGQIAGENCVAAGSPGDWARVAKVVKDLTDMMLWSTGGRHSDER